MQNDQQGRISALKTLLEKVSAMFSSDVWSKRNLLKRKQKEALESLNNAQEKLNKLEEAISHEDGKQTADTMQASFSDNEMLVFISLHQQDGCNLTGWELTLCALESGSISRPIYEKEEQAKQLVSARAASLNEGYCLVKVQKGDVLPVERRDNLGQKLLSLRKGAVKLENVLRFVHFNQDSYSVVSGKLVKT